MMKKVIDCVYLVGILVLIAFTVMKNSLPGILIEYRYLIMALTTALVAVTFVYHQKLKRRR